MGFARGGGRRERSVLTDADTIAPSQAQALRGGSRAASRDGGSTAVLRVGDTPQVARAAGGLRTNGVFLYVQVRVHGVVQNMLVPRMLQQVPVSDRVFLFRRYRRCFTGSDMVAFLLSRRFARSESEALAIGNALLSAGVFRHVRNEFRFRSGNYFYRFAAHEDYTAEDDHVNLRSSRLMTVATSAYLGASRRGSGGEERSRRFDAAGTRGTMSSDDATFCSFDDVVHVVEEEELEGGDFSEEHVEVEIGIRIGSKMYPDLVTKFTTLTDFVSDHRVNNRLYTDCFLGKHAAKWLIVNKYVSSSREAIAVGNAMMKAGVFFPLDEATTGFECNATPYRMMADVDFSAEFRRGQKKDFFFKYFLGIDRGKTTGALQSHSAPWFEDSLSFTTNSSRGL